MAGKRDVSFILQKLRDILFQRKNTNTLRFRDEISSRTQPPPNLPAGPHQKLANNYYYTRDARRLVKPGEIIVEEGSVLQLAEGAEKPVAAVERVPGKVHFWDS